MARPSWKAAGAASALAGLAWLVLQSGGGGAEVPSPRAAPLATPSALPPTVIASGAGGGAATALSALPVPEVAAGGGWAETLRVRLDPRGRVVMDEATRLDLEKLVALNTPEQLAGKLRQLQDRLPQESAREFTALLARYEHYLDALYQALPPGQAPESTEAALAQFERLHALREQYFGGPLAAQLFGAEERQQRQLLEQMAASPRAGTTLQDKADEAQRQVRP